MNKGVPQKSPACIRKNGNPRRRKKEEKENYDK
jgi:hypothetical protein